VSIHLLHSGAYREGGTLAGLTQRHGHLIGMKGERVESVYCATMAHRVVKIGGGEVFAVDDRHQSPFPSRAARAVRCRDAHC
jgi:hypothetical protein